MVTRGKPVYWVLAYTAGVVDSDGHIGICKNNQRPQRYWNPRYQVELVVVNNSWDLMQFLSQHFGGSVRLRKKVLDHHKNTYAWKVGDRQAAILCGGIAEFMQIKHRQARLVVELQEAKAAPRPKGSGRRLTPERVAGYERIFQQFKALNDDRRPQRLSERAPDAP